MQTVFPDVPIFWLGAPEKRRYCLQRRDDLQALSFDDDSIRANISQTMLSSLEIGGQSQRTSWGHGHLFLDKPLAVLLSPDFVYVISNFRPYTLTHILLHASDLVATLEKQCFIAQQVSSFFGTIFVILYIYLLCQFFCYLCAAYRLLLCCWFCLVSSQLKPSCDIVLYTFTSFIYPPALSMEVNRMVVAFLLLLLSSAQNSQVLIVIPVKNTCQSYSLIVLLDDDWNTLSS